MFAYRTVRFNKKPFVYAVRMESMQTLQNNNQLLRANGLQTYSALSSLFNLVSLHMRQLRNFSLTDSLLRERLPFAPYMVSMLNFFEQVGLALSSAHIVSSQLQCDKLKLKAEQSDLRRAPWHILISCS